VTCPSSGPERNGGTCTVQTLTSSGSVEHYRRGRSGSDATRPGNLRGPDGDRHTSADRASSRAEHGPTQHDAFAAVADAVRPQPARGVSRARSTRSLGPRELPAVAIRIYRRKSRGAGTVPGLVWLHGGGYVLGSYDMDAPLLDPLVARTGWWRCLSDYRLAPEAPSPAGVEDAFAGPCVSCSQNADELGVNQSRIAVGGFQRREVARGSGRAAGTGADDSRSLTSNLLYPMIDDTQTDAIESVGPVGGLVTGDEWPFAWRCYLGGPVRDRTDPAGSCSNARHGFDRSPTGLRARRNPGRISFQRRTSAMQRDFSPRGVPAELHVFPGAPHAFDLLTPETAIGSAANALSWSALARVLAA